MRSTIARGAVLVAVLAFTTSASAAYLLEVTEAPGVNTFFVELSATGAEVGTSVTTAQAQVAFSPDQIDPGDISFVSLQALNGFPLGAGPALNASFANPLTFAATGFGTPAPATPTPILQVTYATTRAGDFVAEVVAPDLQNPQFDGTFVATTAGSQADLTSVSGQMIRLSAVPEPSSFLLVGLIGGMGYGCVWLTRRFAKSE